MSIHFPEINDSLPISPYELLGGEDSETVVYNASNVPTIWSTIRDLINSRKIGEHLTRKELLKEIEKFFVNKNKTNNKMAGVCYFSPVTLDCVINMSARIGYLSKSYKRGDYIVMRLMPYNLSSYALRQHYDRYIGIVNSK